MIVSTLVFASCVGFFLETQFSIDKIIAILNNEVKPLGPITKSVERLFNAVEIDDYSTTKELLTNKVDSICKISIDNRYSLQLDVNLADLRGIIPLHVASVSYTTRNLIMQIF